MTLKFITQLKYLYQRNILGYTCSSVLIEQIKLVNKRLIE